jgi:hypothetical protein
MDAGIRESMWLAADPERARDLDEQRQAAIARTQQAEYERLASARPAGLDAYRDLGWRARLARTWLVIVAGLTVLLAVLDVARLNLMSGKTLADVDLDLLQRIDDSDHSLRLVGIILLCAYAFSSAFFAAWTFRAYKNTTALGAQRPRFGAGWAIGGWFVPVLSLWRPKQIVNDIWRTSDPDDPAVLRPDQWRDSRTSALLGWWWGLLIVSNLVGRIGARMSTNTIEQDLTSTRWDLAFCLLTIAAAALAILVVTRITQRQQARAANLRELPAKPPVSDSPPTVATAPVT